MGSSDPVTEVTQGDPIRIRHSHSPRSFRQYRRSQCSDGERSVLSEVNGSWDNLLQVLRSGVRLPASQFPAMVRGSVRLVVRQQCEKKRERRHVNQRSESHSCQGECCGLGFFTPVPADEVLPPLMPLSFLFSTASSRTDLVPPLPVTRTADAHGSSTPSSQQKKNESKDSLSDSRDLEGKGSSKPVKSVHTPRTKAET
ncbi:hypothetical protein JZ751_011778 [Albula glossodonta]|uniref:Uncharacterized protein n=1 Tax=Albula glossodonta TaxID=121402 RepID=A0A8T2PQN4_9TELE|nr:hypothetical protein JZ751_011778 [Albula glossodonta]